VNYAYDAAGRRTSVNDTQSGTISWSYDNANRLLSETTPQGTVSYAYNTASERASMIAADRPPVSYTYDTAGRLSTISQNLTGTLETFTYGYDILSRRTSLQRPNGVTTSYEYDEVNRLKRLKHQKGTEPAIEDFSYEFNTDDEISSISSLYSTPLFPAEDRISNTADPVNRITQSAGASYVFDAMGQTVNKTDANGVTQYQWDARGRLTKVTLPNGQEVSYGYDAVDRRVRQAFGISIVEFLYDVDDTVLDIGSDGNILDYLNGEDIDDKLRQSSTETSSLYFIQDYLTSTVALTSINGNVVQRTQYEPFGQSTNNSLTRYGFTSRERDSLTGLIYYRARWYDPKQTHFISEDPIGLIGGTNFYIYVKNNPVNKLDPTGLLPFYKVPFCKKQFKKQIQDLVESVQAPTCPDELQQCREDLKKIKDLNKAIDQFAGVFCKELSDDEADRILTDKFTLEDTRKLIDRIYARLQKDRKSIPIPKSCIEGSIEFSKKFSKN
jgi:RHS repeat-associated protein